MSDEFQVGQVWEWTIGDDPYNIQELYLLLRPRENMGFISAAYTEKADHVWEALNLETGEIEFVTPMFTAGLWEQLR